MVERSWLEWRSAPLELLVSAGVESSRSGARNAKHDLESKNNQLGSKIGMQRN